MFFVLNKIVKLTFWLFNLLINIISYVFSTTLVNDNYLHLKRKKDIVDLQMFGPKETNIQQYCNYKPNNFFKLFPLRSVDERQVDTTQLVKKDKSYSPDFEKYWYVEKLDSFSEKTHRLLREIYCII